MLIAFCVTPLIEQLCGSNTDTNPENRARVKLPDPLLIDGSFGEKYEAYFRDNFGFRNRLISLYSTLSLKLFKQSPVPNKVHLGLDGWIFAVKLSDGDPLSSLCTAPVDLAGIEDQVARIRDKAHRLQVYRGLPYLGIMAPNKSTIYPEKIGYRFRKTMECAPDVLSKKFTENNYFLFLKDALLAAKKEHVLYMNTDTHWNAYGAWYAFKATMEKLKVQIPDLLIPPMNEFRFEETVKIGGGDLQKMMGVENQFITKSVEVVTDFDRTFSSKNISNDDTKNKLLYPIPSYNLPYSVIVHENPDALNKKRLLLLHDSFGGAMQPMFRRSFQQVVMVPNVYGMSWGVRSAIQPEVAIEERVERYHSKF